MLARHIGLAVALALATAACQSPEQQDDPICTGDGDPAKCNLTGADTPLQLIFAGVRKWVLARYSVQALVRFLGRAAVGFEHAAVRTLLRGARVDELVESGLLHPANLEVLDRYAMRIARRDPLWWDQKALQTLSDFLSDGAADVVLEGWIRTVRAGMREYYKDVPLPPLLTPTEDDELRDTREQALRAELWHRAAFFMLQLDAGWLVCPSPKRRSDFCRESEN